LQRNNRNNRGGNNQVDGLKVEVRNGDFNGAMRRFKKKVQEAGIIQEIRERQHYVKPSEQRKKAKAAGRARWMKKLRKMEETLGPITTRKGR
jgi:small subunit ribosomal protein S21